MWMRRFQLLALLMGTAVVDGAGTGTSVKACTTCHLPEYDNTQCKQSMCGKRKVLPEYKINNEGCLELGCKIAGGLVSRLHENTYTEDDDMAQPELLTCGPNGKWMYSFDRASPMNDGFVVIGCVKACLMCSSPKAINCTPSKCSHGNEYSVGTKSDCTELKCPQNSTLVMAKHENDSNTTPMNQARCSTKGVWEVQDKSTKKWSNLGDGAIACYYK